MQKEDPSQGYSKSLSEQAVPTVSSPWVVPTRSRACPCVPGRAGRELWGALGLQFQSKPSPPSWKCKQGGLGCVCCSALGGCAVAEPVLLCASTGTQPLQRLIRLDKFITTPFAKSCLDVQESRLY